MIQNNRPLSIFFLDAGRKFFGVPEIKSLIDSAAQAGMDMVQLYFSDNQGFRFALEDMRLSTEYGSYDLSRVPGDGYAQEDKAPDGSGRFWTESDMEEILRHGKEAGVEIVPALNMPGHMGAILEHFPQLRYPGSRSSIDLRSPEATAFAKALCKKYAVFFAERGCRFFDLGADEFANDAGGMGFDLIYHNGEMKYFVSFLNELIRMVCGLGMTPMAFNDGIYYKDDLTSYGEIDNRVWVQYWIAGWDTYFPASAKTLEERGFPLVNACHKWYCGAGCPDWAEREEKMASFRCQVFDRETVVSHPAGGMLCCWCDRADFYGTDDGKALAEVLPPVMDAFCRVMGSKAD